MRTEHTLTGEEQKKKCDELRPNCGRCHDLGKDCIYEPIKPRQRRKPESYEETDNDETPTYTAIVADRTVRQNPASTASTSLPVEHLDERTTESNTSVDEALFWTLSQT